MPTTFTWLSHRPRASPWLQPKQKGPSSGYLSSGDLRFSMALGYPPRWLLKLDSRARVTCPGPSAVPRLGPSLASGQRPSDHAGPGSPGPAQPMGWRHPHDPRRGGVGRQAGSLRLRAESPPPPQPGREVSRRGPQCKPTGERVPKLPAPGPKHGGRQGKRGRQGRPGA